MPPCEVKLYLLVVDCRQLLCLGGGARHAPQLPRWEQDGKGKGGNESRHLVPVHVCRLGLLVLLVHSDAVHPVAGNDSAVQACDRRVEDYLFGVRQVRCKEKEDFVRARGVVGDVALHEFHRCPGGAEKPVDGFKEFNRLPGFCKVTMCILKKAGTT